MIPLLAIAGHLATSMIMNQRAKHSQTRSLEEQESMIRRVMATTKGGLGGPVMGYLCVTTRAVRFEKSKSANGLMAYGSIVLPLPRIVSVTAEPDRLFGSTLTLTMSGESHAFGLLFAAYAEELKDLIHQTRGW